MKKARPVHAARPPVPSSPRAGWVLAVGASAGGLEALEALFEHLDSERLCVVVVQHMLRNHSSLLPQLLGRRRKLRVQVADNGSTLASGIVWVSPPDVYLEVEDGILRHAPLGQAAGPHYPIDHFFAALAKDRGPRSAGVVLSGTGDDGTHGLGAIKAAGGLTFAQTPATAKFSGMPSAAVDSGHVRFAGAPREIAEKIAALGMGEPKGDAAAAAKGEGEAKINDTLVRLIADIREKTGTDFSHYKQATLTRRVERRQLMRGEKDVEAYARVVADDAEEMRDLCQDLLISVTSFFRDSEVFALLADKVMGDLVAAERSGGALRVWVPACASGEEAYSLAILLSERLEVQGDRIRPQIFATDIDGRAIAQARRGFYGSHIQKDVGAERLRRFFVARDGGYEVCRRLREMVVFSRQDLLRDAPFSRMDLISCRNLLIYLQPRSQQVVFSTLHYALSPGGLLLLGSSESVGESVALFAVADAKAKLYLRKHAQARRGRITPEDPGSQPPAGGLERPHRRGASLQNAIEQHLREAYGPCGAVVDEHFEVMQFVGDIGPFLAPASGAASFKLLHLLRFELHVETKRAMTRALQSQRRVRAEVALQDGETLRRVGIDVLPIAEPRGDQRCLLVLLLDADRAGGGDASAQRRKQRTKAGGAVDVSPARAQALGAELVTTQKYLRGVIEDAESAREGFRTANEELQSANEELQSTNEELETSKEELQSANEELTTVNEELQGRMVELGETNDDLHNFLRVAESIVVTVDLDLLVRRWTATAEQALRLGAQDIGRHLSCLERSLCCERLADKASAVIESLSVFEETIRSRAGDLFELTISPYKTLDHAIRGAILRLTAVRSTTRVDLEVGLSAVAQPLFALDPGLRLRWGNAAFWATPGLSRRAHLGRELAAIKFFHGLSRAATARLHAAARGGRQLRRLALAVEGGTRVLRGSPLADVRRGPLLLVSLGDGHDS